MNPLSLMEVQCKSISPIGAFEEGQRGASPASPLICFIKRTKFVKTFTKFLAMSEAIPVIVPSSAGPVSREEVPKQISRERRRLAGLWES
jgi:hypothetical protein